MEERKIVLSFKACPEKYTVIVCLHCRSAFSISNEDVVSLMKFKHTFHFLLSPGFFRQRTFLPFFEAFSAFLGTGACSLCQRKVAGMTFVSMIERQSLCSLLQLTLHHWWSNKHFLIPFLSHLWPTWPGLLSPVSLLHPHQIPSSNGEDALCSIVGEDSNLLGRRRKWTRPFRSTGGWCSDLRSSIREEQHHPPS